VIVGQRNEPEPAAAQLDDLGDDGVHRTLPRRLPVGAPHGTERAVLRAATDRLHGSPHVPAFRQQVPPCGLELPAVDSAGLVDALRPVVDAVFQDALPDCVAVAFHDGVRTAEIVRLVGIERGVDTSEDDVCAAFAGRAAYLVAAQRVASVDADTD